MGSVVVVSDKRPETMVRVIVVTIVIARATFVNLTQIIIFLMRLAVMNVLFERIEFKDNME